MRDRIDGLIDQVRRLNPLSRAATLLKEISDYPSKPERPIDYIVEGGPLLRGILGIAVILILIAVPWIIAGVVTQTLSNRITLFSAGTSIFLTFGLLWIYLSIAQSEQRQAEFVEKQTELQREIESLQSDQIDIMGAEFEPVIEVIEYGSANTSPPAGPISSGSSPTHAGDDFHIKISNLTDAIATNLRLRFLVDYLGPQGFVSSTSIPLSRVDNNQTLTAKPGGIIQGQQVEIDYHCIAGLASPLVGRGELFSFTKGLSSLSDNGVSHLRIGMVLVYDDRKGKEHEIELEGLELTSSNWPETPTLARVRNAGDAVSVELIRDRFLERGITQIPPVYRQ